MDAPVFPPQFVALHCPKVSQSRNWRQSFGLPPDPESDAATAECAFVPRGCGIRCENCDRFMATTQGSRAEIEFVPLIKAYYAEMATYEVVQARDEAALQLMELDLGAGI